MNLAEDVQDHWLETAEFMLEAHRSIRLRQRVYDVSTTGARIRTAREVVGLTQQALGKVIGVSSYHISHIECGKRPLKASHLFRIARSLGVKDSWLLMVTDEGGPPVPTEVLRKQLHVDWQAMSNKKKKKAYHRAELERMRGIRGPGRGKDATKQAPAAASDPPT